MKSSRTMRVLGLFLIVSGVCSVPLLSQKLLIRNYTAREGLPSDDVRFVTQDQFGQIWFGTSQGLDCYDGTRHIPRRMYSDAGEAVFSVWRSARADTLVFGSEQSNVNVRLPGNRTYPLITGGAPGQTPGAVVALLEDRSQRLWAGIRGIGLLLVDPEGRALDALMRPNTALDSLLSKSRRIFLKGSTIRALIETSGGSIVIGTDRGAVEVPNGDWNRERNPLPSFPGTGVNAILETTSGDLWFGTEGGGVVVLQHGRVKQVFGARSLPDRFVTSLAEDADGNIWIGTKSRGISRFARGAFSSWTEDDGLASNRVRSLFVDREENVWVSTDKGVSKILRSEYETFDNHPELRNLEFHCVIKDRQGGMWFGITGGVVVYDGGRFHVYRGPAELRNLSVRQILQDSRNNFWLNAGTLLCRFRDGRFEVLKDSSLDEHSPIVDIFEDPGKIVWVTSQTFLFRVLNGKLVPAIRYPARSASFAMDDQGSIWSSTGDGTWRYQDGRLSRVAEYGGNLFLASDKKIWMAGEGVASMATTGDSAFHRIQTPRDHVRAIYLAGFEDRAGTKWFLTDYSIEKLGPAGLEVVQRSALPLMFHRPAEDRQGNIWILTLDGLIRFNRATQSFATSATLMNLLGGGTVMLDVNPSQPIAACDREGGTWFAVKHALVRLAPTRVLNVEPTVFVTQLNLALSAILPIRSWRSEPGYEVEKNNPYFQYWYIRQNPTGEMSYRQDDTLRVLGGQTQVEFECGGLSYSDEADVQYMYRLDNVDETWSPLSYNRRASYAGLTNGTYTFHVRAVSGNGVVSGDRRLSVMVASPFWKTTWFWTYFAITFVYVTGRVYQRRMRRLRLRHREETEHAVLANEFQMARKIQLGMLPVDTPKGKGFDIAATSIPAKEVGGDFYDFAEVADEVYTIAVGDVSGHGLTGAMIVGMARTSLRFAMKSLKRPGEILTLANSRLYDDIKRNLFVAVFFSKLDFGQRTFTYTNAGQVMPALVRKGTAKFLRYSPGDRFPLGIIPRSRYGEVTIRLQKGDVVLLYTDGVVEAMNAAKQEFGFDRLLKALEAAATNNAADMIEEILSTVGRFTGDVEKQDDLTLVVLKAV